ncbi:type IV pilus modification protein PilV [Thalassolituus marinus]|uniref:Type IV pilus modification protein PilV n=1 Tax=Thalassolituus marinus TaxID=671053 RepID=A0ABS7ZNA4_9GAMM|nr:type IV pilus modification protein PilV [Thalassolituus marinus]MCA6063192.1 type IV pilus modification protein PilV [Thalassolituus marinus]
MSLVIQQKGLTLIEVLVTLTITIIGLLGLSTLQTQANRSTLDSGNRSQAVWIIEDLTNRIRANDDALASYDTGGVFQCGTMPTTSCSDYNNGTARVAAAATCTPAEQANWDLWEVACGLPANVASSDFTKGSATDFIANPMLSVEVDVAERRATVVLSWDVRTSGIDADGNQIYNTIAGGVSNARNQISTVIYP